jgi:competence protein ComEA
MLLSALLISWNKYISLSRKGFSNPLPPERGRHKSGGIMMSFKRFICFVLLLLTFLTAAGPAFSAGQIDINTATAVQLIEIKGVGEVLAERIVAYRQQNGEFKSLAELENVKGVGTKKLEKMRPYLTIVKSES